MFHFIVSYSMPWDQTTKLGFYMEIGFCLCSGGSFYFVNGALFLFFISMCFHHQAFYQMFLHSVRRLDRSEENRNKKQIIYALIDFHNSVKE